MFRESSAAWSRKNKVATEMAALCVALFISIASFAKASHAIRALKRL